MENRAIISWLMLKLSKWLTRRIIDFDIKKMR